MTLNHTAPNRTERLRIVLRGFVQGVGFRPMVCRLAQKLRVAGWVRHSGAALKIEVEGSPDQLNHFLHHLKSEKPPAAEVTREEVSRITPTGGSWFEILPSDEIASEQAAV
jgi:hydrogenase maturation protein HypF